MGRGGGVDIPPQVHLSLLQMRIHLHFRQHHHHHATNMPANLRGLS
jgi:hypothetical protein